MEFTTSIAIGFSATSLAFGVCALIWSSRQKNAVTGLAQAMQSAGTGLEHLNEQLVAQQRTLSRAQARLRHCQRAVRELRDSSATKASIQAPPAATQTPNPGIPVNGIASESLGNPMSPTEAQLLDLMQRSSKTARAA